MPTTGIEATAQVFKHTEVQLHIREMAKAYISS